MDQFVDLTKIKLDNVKNVIKKFRTLPLPKDVEVNLNSSSRLGAKSVKKLKGLQDAIYEMIPKSAIDFEFFKKAFFNQPKENFNENLANMTDIDQHTDDMGSHMDDIIEGSSRHSMSIAQPSIAKKKPIKLKKPKIATIIESEEDDNDEENEKQINKIAHKRIQKGLNKIHVKKREAAEIKLDALFQDHDMFVKAYNDIYEYIRKNLKSSSYKPEDLHFDKISNMFLKNLQKSLNTQEYKKIVSDYIKNRDLNSKSYEPSGILKYLVKTQLNCTNDINKINQEQITLEQEVEQLKSADNGKKIMNFIKNSYMTYHEIYNTDGFDVNQMLENLSNVKTSITTSMTDAKMEIVNNFYTYFSAMADNFADMNIPNFSLLGNLCKNIAGLLVGYKEDYNNGALGKAQLVVYDNLINAAIKAIVLRINTIAEDAIIIEYNGQRILKNDEPIDSELRDERLRNLFPDINQTFWPSDDDNDSNDDYKPFKGGDKIVAETSKKAPPKKTKEENSTDFESATEDIPKNKDSKTKKNSKMIIDDALVETEEEATTPKPVKPSSKEATSPKPLKPKPKSLKPSPIKTLLNRKEYTKRQKEQLTSQQLGSLAQLTEATTLLSNQVNPEQLKVEVAGVDYSNIPANNHFKAIQASVGKDKPEATTPMVVDEVSQLMSHLIRISRTLAQSLVGNTVIPQSIYSFYSSFISNLHLSNAETKLKLLQAKQKELEAYVKFPSAIIKAQELTRLYSRYFELTKSSVPVPKEAKVGGSETTVPMNVEDSEVASIMMKEPVKKWSTPARTRIRATRPMSDSEVQARIKENDYAFRNTKADILSLGRNLTEEQQKDKESMNAYANALYDENLKLKVEMKIRYANNQLRSLQDVLANSDNDILKVEAKVKIGRIEKEMNEDLTALVNSIDDDDYIELTSMNVLETQTAAQVDPPVPPVSNTSIIQPQPSSELIPEPMPEVRPPDPVRVEQLVDPNLPDQFAIMADIERRNRARQPEATQPAVEELANSRGSSTIPAIERQFTIMADIERRNRVDGTQQPAVVATRLPTSSNRVTGLEVEELANSRGFSTAPAVASNTFSSENMARFYNELRAADNRASSQQYSRLARSVANANMRDRIQGRVITDEGRLGVTTRESVNEILRRTREHTRETVQYYTTLVNRDVRRAEHLQRIGMIGEELSAVQRSMDYHRTLIAETRRVGEETLAMLTDSLATVPEERPQSTTPMVSDRPTTPINLENRATTPVVTYLDPNIQSTLNNLYRFIRTNRALTIRLASVTDFSERVAIEVQIESNINEMNSTINSLDQTARDAILNDVTVNSYMLERRMERQNTEQNMTNSNRTPQQRVDSAQYQATIKIKSAESAEFTPSRMVDNQIRRQFSETEYPEASVGRLAASVQGLKVYRDEYATRVTEYDELRRLLPNLSPHDMNPYETLAMLSTKLSKYEKALTLEDAETSRGWLTAVFIPVDKYISQAISQRLSRKQTDQIPRLILNMIESPEFLGQFIRAFGLSTEVVNRYGIFLDNLKKLYDNRFQFGISASTEVAAAIQSLTEIYLSMGTQNQELLNYYNINNTSSSSHYNNIYSDRAEIMLTSTALNYSVPEGMYNLSSLVETPLEEEPENYELDVERERRNIDQYVENMRTNMIPAILQLKNLLLNQAMQGDLPALNATNETLSRISTAANNWFREQILVFQILKNKIINLGYDPVKYRISLDAMKELLSSVNNIHNEIRSLLQTPTEIENSLRRSNYRNDFATPQAIIEEFGNIDPTSVAANANPPALPPSNLPQPQQPQQPSGSAPNTENNEDDNNSHMGEGISKIKKMHEERKRITQEHKYEKHKPIPKLIIAHGIVTDHMNKSNDKKEAPKDVICEHCGRGILKNDNDDMHLSNTKEIMHKKCFSAKGCTPKRIPYKKAFGYDITEDSKNEQAKKLYQQKLEYKNYVDVKNDKDTNMFEEFIDSAQKYIKNPEKLLDLALKREIFVGPFNGRRLNELVFLIGAYNNTSEGEFNDTMLEHNLEIGIAKFLLNKDYKTTNETYLPSSNFEKLKNRILNSPGILANLHF